MAKAVQRPAKGLRAMTVAVVFQSMGIAPPFAENAFFRVGIVIRFQFNGLTLCQLFLMDKQKTEWKTE
jgi:membrane protease YdiL (CAAX protease family)